MHCQPIMGPRGDWQITEDSLRGRLGQCCYPAPVPTLVPEGPAASGGGGTESSAAGSESS